MQKRADAQDTCVNKRPVPGKIRLGPDHFEP